MTKRRSSPEIISQLIGLIAPLKLQMTLAILLGVIGFLLSFGIGILGGYAVLSVLAREIDIPGFVDLPLGGHQFSWYIIALVVCAVLRGVLHYIEQFCNHYIAFRILAEMRHKVFSAMRRLAPAKLEGENQGQLISIIMGDIELLEIFYAHTISPVMIASLVTIVLFVFFAKIHILVALVALLAQLVVGVIVPIIASERGKEVSVKIRRNIGNLNGKFLDQLRGIREIIQYDKGDHALREIDESTRQILDRQNDLKSQISALQANTDTIIIIFSVLQLLLCARLVMSGTITHAQAFIAVLTQISTFAPYIALANLGGTLTQTFACGDRILNLLEEEPIVKVVVDGKDVVFDDVDFKDLTFAYEDRNILNDISFKIKKGETLGIMGRSGSGKSTLLKLLMRFWDPQEGSISINGINIKDINTQSLYSNIDYMTQTTILFAGSIRDNLRIAKADASDEEIYEALRKASIDEDIRKLENGLDTRVSDLGDNFSGGERQRIGLARCFLTDSQLLLLDEPTSNLDSYNEAIILKSLVEGSQGKTIVMVSHRESTMGVCDRIIRVKDSRVIES
nr:thiol reductant ABC exporter subunit CydC [uncultured Peptostreptococcus sp.]